MSESTALTTRQDDSQIMEGVLLGGDLSKLTANQRVTYYQRVCESVGLNPLTKPFGYINLNNKLVLYALKDAAEQLRKLNHVSITQIEKQFADDLYIVTAHAQTPDGRTDASTGAVTISNLKGDSKANAIMKAETKAKRRVTLSICGMGFLDESEISSIPDARPVTVTETGEFAPEQPKQNDPESVPVLNVTSAPAQDTTTAAPSTTTIKAAVNKCAAWPPELVTWACHTFEGVNPHRIIAALNKSSLLWPDSQLDTQKHWLNIYRKERETVESDEATKRADADLQATQESK